MPRSKNLSIKKARVKVITGTERKESVSSNDLEMDARAKRAVKAAVDKAQFCKKPVAKYDVKNKKAYIEFADGKRKYVE